MVGRPRIAILTLHPDNTGGVVSMMKAVYRFCGKYFDPTLFFLGFDSEISARLRPPSFTSKTRRGLFDGMPYVEVGSRFAFWEPSHYSATLDDWKRELASYEYIFVVSGTAIAAHPLVLLKKPFLLWVASSHDADRQNRVAALSGVRRFLYYVTRRRMRAIEKAVLQAASYVLALSRYTKESLGALCCDMSAPLEVCGYPIARSSSERVCADARAHTIIAVGRFADPRKNVDMLLRAFGRVATVVHDVKLLIVGSEPPSSTLLPYQHLAWFSRVFFTGLVDAARLREYYQQSSLMFITSHQEGLGIIGLEALSQGVPVIATRCGGPEDFVLDGVSGYLVGCDDDAVMARRATEVLSDKALYAKLVEGGYKVVDEYFSEQYIHSRFKHSLKTVYPDLRLFFEQGAVNSATFMEHNEGSRY